MHFGTSEWERGPLEAIVRKVYYKPMVFGTFGEMSDGVKEVVEIAIDYGAEHLGRSMATTTVEAVRAALRRIYTTQLSMTTLGGYANTLISCWIGPSISEQMFLASTRLKSGDRGEGG